MEYMAYDVSWVARECQRCIWLASCDAGRNTRHNRRYSVVKYHRLRLTISQKLTSGVCEHQETFASRNETPDEGYVSRETDAHLLQP